MVGLYGVMSYMVMRRRSEIAIRMALGADRVAVVRMVLRESAILVALGAVLGLALSVLAARWVSTLLFGLSPGDPLTLAVSAAALGAAAACASYLPARRAAPHLSDDGAPGIGTCPLQPTSCTRTLLLCGRSLDDGG